VVVLSNNDGCAVARSDEVKAAGIPMGAPYFKYKAELEKINCKVCSSNYTLYGDMSRRVMSILATISSDIEIYSIDEAFLLFDDSSNLEEFAQTIIKKIYKETGIPVCVGIGYTKTQAKLANYVAKYDMRKGKKIFNGVFSMVNKPQALVDNVYDNTSVSEVWGIGRQSSKKLKNQNINTISDLLVVPEIWVRKNLTIQGLRIVRELKGIICYKLEDNPANKKSIASTRSFGISVTQKSDLAQAISQYCSTVGQKLRKQNLVTPCIQVFILTDRFKENLYYNSITCILEKPTNYTPHLIKEALKALDKIYLSGQKYKKAGVFVTDLVPKNYQQIDLFDDETKSVNNQKAMLSVDKLNKKFGKSKIRSAAVGYNHAWSMNRNLVSSRYTTNWKELLKVK
jgi:DNA polymerase V